MFAAHGGERAQREAAARDKDEISLDDIVAADSELEDTIVQVCGIQHGVYNT
jgi:hypothetical protein